MKFIRRMTAVAAVSFIAASVGIFGAPANAATGPGGRVITCKVSIDYPHGSVHVGGTISSSARVQCDATVAEIFVRADLLNIPKKTNATQSDDRFNSNYLIATASKSCSEGPSLFKATASVQITFPPGFKPLTTVTNKSSPNWSVACGLANALRTVGPSAAADESSSWTITATKAD
jgi:hypothetical protein